MVTVVGDTNYKPTGTSYTGTASTTVETGTVVANDTYIFDGTSWELVHAEQPATAWGTITGTLADQTDLKNALDAKVTGNSAITGATKCKITYDSKGLVTAGADLQASDIPDLSGTYATLTSIAKMANKMTATNPALTASGGQCTWSITNTLGTDDVVVSIKEVSSGDEVYAEVVYGSGTITVKMNSSSNISAGTYKAVIIGQ